MAKKKSKKTKPAARKPAPQKKAAAKSKTARKSPPPKKSAAKSSRKAAAPSHDGVFKRMLDRVKPLLKKPVDPRIKHMVEVFGVEAVVGLIDAHRRKQDAAHREELAAAMTQAEKGLPPAHGSWAWHELMTNDVGGSKRFYSAMFGWQSTDLEMMPGFNYTIFNHMGKDVAGMMALAPEHGDMPPGWGVYVAVDDVDAAADKAETLGGEVIVPPHDIPVGRWAMVKDPAGAMVCLYRAQPA